MAQDSLKKIDKIDGAPANDRRRDMVQCKAIVTRRPQGEGFPCGFLDVLVPELPADNAAFKTLVGEV